MKDDTIYFHLPGFVKEIEVLNVLFLRLGQCPEHYYDNIKVGSVYGCPPGALWNGGRLMRGTMTKEELQKLVKIMSNWGIPLRYTWTNPVLDENDLQDEFCNFVMNVSDNGLNQVLVGTDLMENYIRENYPNFPIISSTTKRITDPKLLEEEINKDYKLVVLDYDFNNDWDVLKHIKHPEKCEILLNPVCNPKCQLRKIHYKILGQLQKGDFSGIDTEVVNCPYQVRGYKTIEGLPTFIKREDLYNKYVKKGFRNFKIEGRGSEIPFKLVHWILYYMVKPEYIEEEREWYEIALLNTIYSPRINAVFGG